uniref:Uncharacterized protein n=1 Tax=Acrobeloides nanus TaxID=290746 RepID=A0A914D678_9BILA
MHGSVRKLSTELKNAFMKNKNETFKVCLPALIYVIQNNLYYFALKHVDATLFSITYQLRILTTALLMVILLNKIFSGTQWAALFISLLGVILVQASSQTSGKAQEANPENSKQFLGLMTVLGMCWMSAFAGVYLEGVLKKSSCDIWLQNIRLSMITLPFALLTIAHDSSVISQYGFFYGWSPLVWVVSISGAVGGLIIAAVMKYADNIKKSFSTSVALGGTSILSILMGDSVFSFLLMFGVSLVMLSVFLYTLNPPGKQSDKIQPVETRDNSNTFLEESPTEFKKTTNENI